MKESFGTSVRLLTRDIRQTKLGFKPHFSVSVLDHDTREKFSISSRDFAENLLGKTVRRLSSVPGFIWLSPMKERSIDQRQARACEFPPWHLSNCRSSLQEQKLASCCQQGEKMKLALSYLAAAAWTRGHVSPSSYIPVIVAATAKSCITGVDCLAVARYVLTESSWNKNKLPEEQRKQFILQALLSGDNTSWVVRMLKYPFKERTPVDAAALPAEIAALVVVPPSLRQTQEYLISDGT